MLPSVDPAAKGAQHGVFGGRARQPRPTVKTGGLLVTTTEHAAELTIPAAPTRAAPVVRRLESTGFMNNVLRLRPKVAMPLPAPEALELGTFLELLGVQDKQSLQVRCSQGDHGHQKASRPAPGAAAAGRSRRTCGARGERGACDLPPAAGCVRLHDAE
jgi:hypothetical protein